MSAPDSSTLAFPEGRRRAAVAALFIAPILMLSSAAAGVANADAAEQIFDLLSVPALFAWGVVILLATRSWSRRWAWTAMVALTLQVTALAAVVGMDILQHALVDAGVSESTVNDAMDEGIMSSPAGVMVFVWFMPVLVIGLVAAAVALLRTRPIPKFAGIGLLLLLVSDVALPEDPQALRVLPFVFMLGSAVTIALAIRRTGIPTRASVTDAARADEGQIAAAPAEAAATF